MNGTQYLVQFRNYCLLVLSIYEKNKSKNNYSQILSSLIEKVEFKEQLFLVSWYPLSRDQEHQALRVGKRGSNPQGTPLHMERIVSWLELRSVHAGGRGLEPSRLRHISKATILYVAICFRKLNEYISQASHGTLFCNHTDYIIICTVFNFIILL